MADPKIDGGPAFPVPNQTGGWDPKVGMSLRDWFAGQAIDRMLTLSSNDEQWDPAAVAVGCYLLADAMLAERMKTNG